MRKIITNFLRDTRGGLGSGLGLTFGSGGGAPAPAAYAPKWVDNQGTARYAITTGTVADSRYLSLAFKIIPRSVTGTHHLWKVTGDNPFYLSNGKLTMYMQDSAGAVCATLTTGPTLAIDQEYFIELVADAQGAGAVGTAPAICTVKVNGTDYSPSMATSATGLWEMSGVIDFLFGGTDVEISEMYFSNGPLTSGVLYNGGVAANLATLSGETPLVYFGGGQLAADWNAEANLGSIPDTSMTLTGTFIDSDGITSDGAITTGAGLKADLEDAALAYGDIIAVKAGTYAAVTVARTTPPTGTFTGSNHVRIVPFPGDAPVLNQFRLNDTSGTGANNRGLSFEGLIFDTNVAGANSAALKIDGSSYAIKVTDSTFAPQTGTWGPTDAANLVTAIGMSVPGPHNAFEATGNTIRGAKYGMYLIGDDMIIRGNDISKCTDDCRYHTGKSARLIDEGNYHHSPMPTYSVHTITAVTEGATTVFTVSGGGEFNVNDSIRLQSRTAGELASIDDFPYAVSAGGTGTFTIAVDTTSDVAWTAGGVIWQKTSHQDSRQFDNIATGDGDDMVIRGNRTFRGDAEDGWQGMQGDFASASGTFDNLLYEGNEVATDLVQGVNFGATTNSTFQYSIIASVPNAWGPRQGVPQLFVNTGSGGNTVAGMLGHASTIAAGNTETNNDFTLATTAVALDAEYNAPQITSADAALADTAYAIEAGSAADLATPKRGASPWQQFTSPWTFTTPS